MSHAADVARFVLVTLDVVEAIGLSGLILGIAVGAVNLPFAFLFFLCAYGYGLTLTTITLLGEDVNYHRYEGLRNRLILVRWAMLESLGYRQLTVFWRLRGLFNYLRGRTEWGAMERRGFRQIVPAASQTGARPAVPGNTRPAETPVARTSRR